MKFPALIVVWVILLAVWTVIASMMQLFFFSPLMEVLSRLLFPISFSLIGFRGLSLLQISLKEFAITLQFPFQSLVGDFAFISAVSRRCRHFS